MADLLPFYNNPTSLDLKMDNVPSAFGQESFSPMALLGEQAELGLEGLEGCAFDWMSWYSTLYDGGNTLNTPF